jgi:mono/diheme cytochrome c family protein
LSFQDEVVGTVLTRNRTRRGISAAVSLYLCAAGWSALHAAPQAPVPAAAVAPARAAAQSDAKALLAKYCVTCHNQRTQTGGLSLEGFDPADVAAHGDLLEKIVRKVRVGMMPPAGMPRPDSQMAHAFVASLESALDRQAAAKPNPGRPMVHRLNRVEYAYAIRDLLDLEIDPVSLLPPDETGYGFDNISDLLGTSPLLLERYLNAAGRLSALAVGDPAIVPGNQTFIIRQDRSQDTQVDGMPIGTFGGGLARVTLPLDGEYVINAKLFRTNLGAMRGLELANQAEFTVDGRRVLLVDLGGEKDHQAHLTNPTVAGDEIDSRLSVRVPLKAGPHVVTVGWIRRVAEPPWKLQPFTRSSIDTIDMTGRPHFDRFAITGPFNATGPGDTPSRRKVFACRPPSPSGLRRDKSPGEADEETCARRIVSTLGRRAFRGQLSDGDLSRLMEFYRRGHKDRGFEGGIQLALQRILASPKFIWRVERDPATVAAGKSYRLSDVELASRLSFFLWSSIPDDELLELARQGRLSTPAVLDRQLRRMLTDAKIERFVTNFAGQWLYLRNLKNQIPDSVGFPNFDDNLRQAFLRETELFVGSIVRENRSVLDLMTADYTFVNERLAKHYGYPNIYGSEFRRVTHPDERRRGLLGQGSILTVTSHADRTSPVVRGKWILDNLLGAPPPLPPMNVPPLPDDERSGRQRVLSVREKIEKHRASPACASCHKIMDPIGLALENFDAVGAYRERDGQSLSSIGTPIDATGQLMDGTQVDGVVTLRKALLKDPEVFVGALTEKLMTYAVGRGVAYYDMPTVRAIVRDAKRTNYSVTSLVSGVVRSAAFQMRMKSADAEAGSAASTAD